MRTILLTMAVLALARAVTWGQVRALRAGSAEALDLLARQRQDNAEAAQRTEKRRTEHEKELEFGRTLFGVDERWGGWWVGTYYGNKEGKVAGTLIHKKPIDFSIGDWGCTSYPFQVLSKVSKTEILAIPRYSGSAMVGGPLNDSAEVVLIRGLDTSKVTDGIRFVLQHPVIIQNTYTYKAVSGGQKTVLVLECDDRKLNQLAEAARRAAEDALFRNWADSSGKFSVVARFMDFKNNQVHLERKEDGNKIAVPMSRLSKEDQEWIRDELKRRTGDKRKAGTRKAATNKP